MPTSKTDIQCGNYLFVAYNLLPCIIRFDIIKINEIVAAIRIFKLSIELIHVVYFHDFKFAVILLRIKAGSQSVSSY